MAAMDQPSEGRARRPRDVASLRKGMQLLDLLADVGGECSLRKLSASARIPESTAHALLQTLVRTGHIRRTDARTYVLGASLLKVGETTNRMVSKWASPWLQRLSACSGETADLAVLDGEEVVYVAQVPSAYSARSVSQFEHRLPVWTAAAGVAILSQLPPKRMRALIERDGASSAAERNAHLSLMAEVGEARMRRFAIERGCIEADICCIAVPLRSTSFASALTISGPIARLPESSTPALLTHMWRVAAEMSTSLQRMTQMDCL